MTSAGTRNTYFIYAKSNSTTLRNNMLVIIDRWLVKKLIIDMNFLVFNDNDGQS